MNRLEQSLATGARGRSRLGGNDNGDRGVLRGSLLLLAAADDGVTQHDGQKEDPTWGNQEEDPQQHANDDRHARSYEHLPCHAQWASRWDDIVRH